MADTYYGGFRLPQESPDKQELTILEAARDRIYHEQDRFVCHAIEDAASLLGYKWDNELVRGLCTEVHRIISPWESVTTFLDKTGDDTPAKLFRLDMLDKMIAEREKRLALAPVTDLNCKE